VLDKLRGFWYINPSVNFYARSAGFFVSVENSPSISAPRQPLTDALVLEAIERLSLGESLRDACRVLNLNEFSVRSRIIRDESLGTVYARARENYADILVDRLMDIAQDQDDPARARLMCDNVKWCAAKILPKKFGDKTVLTGPNDGPVQFEYTSSADAKQALEDLARRVTVINSGD
jgi:hypothetical protein